MRKLIRARLLIRLVLGFAVCLLLLSARWLTNPASIVDRLTQYITQHWQEKVYLHFDKPYYSTGETIWFKSYLVNAATHRPDPRSTLLYVELIAPNETVIAQRHLKVVDGGAAGGFALPDSLPAGTYRVRAYTRWMRNFDADYFFSRSFPVWSTDSTAIGRVLLEESQTEGESFVYEDRRSLVDLQFFPEGGELVDGLTSLVAFKAVGPDGKSIEVSGTVVNQTRQEVARFDTYHRGMGGFILKPIAGESYTAQVDLHGVPLEFTLPKVRERGYALRLSHPAALDEVKVTVHATEGLAVGGGTLVIHQRGLVIAALEVQEGAPFLVVDLDKSIFPPGVSHLTFFDASGTPRCERLFFPSLPTLSAATIDGPSSVTATRQRVELSVALRDSSGRAIRGQASLTVTNPREVTYSSYAEDIRSNLLLTSDLKGYIEQPSYYLEDTSAAAYRARDFLMLTQGWRRFRWSDVLSDSVPAFPYVAEQGFTISGRLVNFYNRNKSARGTIGMMVMDRVFAYAEGETNAAGQFAFVDNQLEDSTEIVLQARRKVANKDKLRTDVAIQLDEHTPPPFTPAVRPRMTPTLAMMNDYLHRRRQIDRIDSAYNFDEKTIVLEGVEVKGRRDKRNDPFYRASQLYDRPNNRLVVDSMPGARNAMSVFELLRRVPGVRVVGTFPNQTAVIRGMSIIGRSSEALFLVDGVPGDASMVNNLSMNDVYYVDVLKGPSAAIYGSRGANGAIAVYTRRGSQAELNEERQGIINFTHPGYSEAREFYAPRYDIQKPEHIKPDLRSTLFWEPDVKFDENGQATVSFYTSDQPGSYDVRLEGLTEQGEPVVGKARFTVKK